MRRCGVCVAPEVARKGRCGGSRRGGGELKRRVRFCWGGSLQADGKTVAVKRVDIFDMAAKKRERCLQEVQLLKTLSHPHIIKMVDSFIDENTLIICFEWAPAGDLKRLLRRHIERREPLSEHMVRTRRHLRGAW